MGHVLRSYDCRDSCIHALETLDDLDLLTFPFCIVRRIQRAALHPSGGPDSSAVG